MDSSARDDRLLDLARRLLDGEAIDWAAEGVEESEVLEGMKRLQPMLRMADGTETATGKVVVEKVGDRYIGDFRLVRKLGEGGMGVVYEAEQQHPPRAVALKVSRGGAHVSSETLKLFPREAHVATHSAQNPDRQLEILKLADVFITHGGMGSVSEGLLHSVPLIVIPQTSDRPFVAQRVRRLGAGYALYREPARPAELIRLVDAIVADESVRAECNRIAESFKEAGGAVRAADVILDYLSAQARTTQT